jgi:hypothetical protein
MINVAQLNHQRLGSGLLWSNADSAFGQRAVKSVESGRYADVADPERAVGNPDVNARYGHFPASH